MKKQSGRTSIASIVLTIVLLIILVITFNYFRASYFNGFEKAVIKNEKISDYNFKELL